MSKHTPLPWTSNTLLTEGDYNYAALCVNNHAKLVEALRDCSDELAEAIEGKYHGILGYPSTDRDYKTDMAVVEKARTMLAQLDGEQE